nr:uncharacterized protein LOC108067443 [Drosophila takahashii]
MDLDGSDWSKNVIYLTGTPKRAVPPEITNTLPLANTSIPKSEPLHSTTLGTPQRPFTSRNNHASESIGKRFSRRLRGNSHIKNGNTSPETVDPALEPPAQLAKSVDVTGYFHRISANLVEQRVSLKSFEALRKRINLMVTKTLNESKKMRK